MELAVDHEGTVGGEEVRDGSDGQLAGLVGVTEEKLAGGEGGPAAGGEELALAGLRGAFDAEVVGVAEAVGEAEVFAGGGVAVADLAGGVLGGEEGGGAALVEQGEDGCGAGFEGSGRDGVDAEPEVDAVFSPDGLPVFGRVDAVVAEDFGALAHTLLKLDGEGEEGGLGEVELNEAAVGKGEVKGAVGFAASPALPGGDLTEKCGEESAGACGVGEFEEEVAGYGKIVAVEDEALDVGLVELTHCGRRS